MGVTAAAAPRCGSRSVPIIASRADVSALGLGDYAGLLGTARLAATRICALPESGPLHGRATFIKEEAAALLRATSSTLPALADGVGPEALSMLVSKWPDVRSGTLTGEEIFRWRPGLWERLMLEWPMGAYATLAAGFLESIAPLQRRQVLEVGAGVGAATRQIAHLVSDGFRRSDRYPAVMQRCQAPGEVAAYNFDEEGRWSQLDIVFAVNALHCARNPRRTLGFVRDMLRSGGLLLLAEGEPYTTGYGTPWALTFFFGLFDGWWDRGGFRSRNQWIEDLAATGYTQIGTQRLIWADHDLGGLIWAYRGD